LVHGNQLNELVFETTDLLPDKQVLLLSFLIALVKAIHLRGDFVKTLAYLTSKRANFSLHFFAKKQTQSVHLVLGEWHAPSLSHQHTHFNAVLLIRVIANVRISFGLCKTPELN
jgi:hypothetical protein